MDLGTILVIALFAAMIVMHLRPHRGHGAGGGCCGGHAHSEHEQPEPSGERQAPQSMKDESAASAGRHHA